MTANTATPQRITHGRHCTCSACAREDWTQPHLAAYGMHGSSCAREYQPWGGAGTYYPPTVPADAATLAQTVREGLVDGNEYSCGCDRPGDPQTCIHADRFAALAALEERATRFETALRDIQAVRRDAKYSRQKMLTIARDALEDAGDDPVPYCDCTSPAGVDAPHCEGCNPADTGDEQ